MKADCTLIDVCLGCYLTDHHNRPGELLLGVCVDGDAINGHVLSELRDALQCADYGLPSWFDYDAARAAMGECFAAASPTAPFDSSLDPPEEDDYMSESCQAWFLLTYSRK